MEVEYRDGQVALEALRFVVVHSSQLAQQQRQTYAIAQKKEAAAVTDHVQRVETQPPLPSMSTESWAAVAANHTPGGSMWYVIASSQPLVARAALRGRPAKADPQPTEVSYRLMVEVETLANPEDDNGWMVLATTVSGEACTDAEILLACQEQHTTVEPGFRWIKNPAAISPVWLEKPERIAALVMLTVVGLLVYSII
jgi:transposase